MEPLTPKGTNECLSCRKTFSQKSSLVRHLKLCTRVKSASLRQKSCQQCAGAKAKCNLRRPTCSRCTSREVPCTYTSGSSESDGAFEPTTPDLFSVGTMYPPGGPDMDTMLDGFDQDIMNDVLTQGFDNNPPFSDTLARWSAPEDYSKTVACAPEFVRLESPWISTLLLPSTETPDGTPELAKHSMQSLLRAMRTWPRILCKGLQMPPVFHHSVVKNKDIPLPLANCCTLVHMWDRQYEGTSSIVQDTILKEIKTIFENFKTYNEPDSLAALQAVTMYAIMLCFPSKSQSAIPYLDPSLFVSIQAIVQTTAMNGLVLQEESEHCMPSWESWIHITSKRRAVFALYLLHWSYCVYHRLQSFDCNELGYMLAPAPKYLWQATEREQWEGLYRAWLAQWEGREFMQHEFMTVKPGIFLDDRTQLWLEDTDELGMLFMSIFNATDREAYGFLPRAFSV